MYANVESDLVWSGGCPHIKIHTTTLLCISAHLAKSWVWKLILWGVNMERLVFAASNMTNVMQNCEKPTWTWTKSPANSDVTSHDIYYNLLEFWITCDCRGSRIVYTSLINTKKNCCVTKSILHNLENFGDGRMNISFVNQPRVKSLQTRGQS